MTETKAVNVIIEEEDRRLEKRTKPRRVSGAAVVGTTKRSSMRGLGNMNVLVERNDSMDRTLRAALISRGSSTRGLDLKVDDDGAAQKLFRRKPPGRTGSFVDQVRRSVGRTGSFKAVRQTMRELGRSAKSARTFDSEIPSLERSDSMRRYNRSMLSRRSSSRKSMNMGVVVDKSPVDTDEDNDTQDEEDVIEDMPEEEFVIDSDSSVTGEDKKVDA